MTINHNQKRVAQGVSFTAIQDRKFRHNRLSLNFVVPMSSQTVSEYALLSYLLRRATKDCPDFTKLNRRLDALYGAALSCDVTKVSANQVISFGISFIDDAYTPDGENVTKQCAELLCEMVTRPLIENGQFLEQDFLIEQKNLIDTIASNINDKRSYAVSACRELMGRGDESALRKLGTIEQAKAITPRSAAEAYAKLMREAQIVCVFVGAGDGVDAEAVIHDNFASLERTPLPLASPKKFTPDETPLELVERMDVAQAKLVLGFSLMSNDTPEDHAANRVMTALYGGTPSSKLFMNVREKLSLCYYCAARYDKSASVVMVDSGVERQNIERAKTEILAQLADIVSGDFEQETLDNTKNLLKTAYQTVNDSISSIEDWYLQRIITDTLATPEEELELLLNVTPEDVRAAAAKTKLDAIYLLTGREESHD